MTNRILLIYNPRAGKGLFLNSLPGVIDMFVKAGYAVEVYPTQAAGDAAEYIRNLEGEYNMIVPAGGDGTLDEVFTGMIASGKRIPIGYIPVGSTNDYASSIGISSNIIECVGDIIGGTRHGVDVGIVNDSHVFVYVAAFGAFTQVSYETNQDMKNSLGHIAYILEGVRRLGDIKSYPMRVKIDDRVFQQDYIFGMVTNSISVGGMKNLPGKESEIMLDDGVFEATLIHTPRNVIELQEIIGALMSGTHDTDMIDYFKTDHIELSTKEPLPWTMDGEYGGTYTDVKVVNRQKALDLVFEKHRATIS
jgi:diacylglycerol kinase (ATP)